MTQPEMTSPIFDCQPGSDDCWVKNLPEDDYHFTLAANLKALEDHQDEEGSGQLWSTYGHRACTNALHIVEVHPELMSPPNVPVVAGAGREE